MADTVFCDREIPRDTVFIVRLGACIGFEIGVGLAALAGLSLGTAYALGELRGDDSRGRSAAVDAQVRAPEPIPVLAEPAVPRAETLPPRLELVPAAATVPTLGVAPPGDSPIWEFVGVPDRELLAPLTAGAVKTVKFNRGGTTLSLRLEFEGGARAAFKPDQMIQQLPRREIAAYRLDRLLGIGRVPPAIGRSFTIDELVAAVDPGHREFIPRLRAEAVTREGMVRGELSWWIPVISDVYIGAARLDETEAIVTWRRWLKVGATIPPARVGLAHQLSAMTLFDFVTDNVDRWSGNNSKTSKDGSILYFMDNTLSFGRSPNGNYRTRRYLERCQVFSRRLVERLRASNETKIEQVLAVDPGPYPELLTAKEITAVMGRRKLALAYIDDLIATHGEAKVLAFP